MRWNPSKSYFLADKICFKGGPCEGNFIYYDSQKFFNGMNPQINVRSSEFNRDLGISRKHWKFVEGFLSVSFVIENYCRLENVINSIANIKTFQKWMWYVMLY